MHPRKRLYRTTHDSCCHIWYHWAFFSNIVGVGKMPLQNCFLETDNATIPYGKTERVAFHKVRQHFFCYLWHPLPQISTFLYLSVIAFSSIFDPSPSKKFWRTLWTAPGGKTDWKTYAYLSHFGKIKGGNFIGWKKTWVSSQLSG